MCVSIPPAVTILPSAESTSVQAPISIHFVTPSIRSGLPALPMPTMRPSRMPMSAFTTPHQSMMIAFVITRSSAPFARVAAGDCPMPSRMTLPPPNFASSPDTVRSRVISINKSVSARRIRSTAVGPYRSAYWRRGIFMTRRLLKTAPSGVLGRPSPCDVPLRVRLSRRTPCGLAGNRFEQPSPFFQIASNLIFLLDEALLASSSHGLGLHMRIVEPPMCEPINPIGHTIAADRDQCHPLVFAWLKPHRGSSRNLQAKPIGLFTIKPQRAICLEEMTMRPDLNRPITGIGNENLNYLTVFERHNVAFTEDDFTGNYCRRLSRKFLGIATHALSRRHFLLGSSFLFHRFTYRIGS